jgi:RHS repeat-associated protein
LETTRKVIEDFYAGGFCSWLLGDHLGSTSMVADASGTVVNELRYSAFGEIRYQNGIPTTDYLYTGQRQEAEIGLYYYVARWYDPAIGRFIQADSVVPNPMSSKGFDRYSYSYNSPLIYLDPSGHRPIYLDGEQFAETDQSQGITNYVSTTYRPNANNTNNWKPPSDDDKKVDFPDKNYNPEEDNSANPLEETHENQHEIPNHENELPGEIILGDTIIQFSPELFNPLFYMDAAKFALTGLALSGLGVGFVAIGAYTCTLGPVTCAAGVFSAGPAAVASFVASGLVFYGGFKYVESHFSHSIHRTKQDGNREE